MDLVKYLLYIISYNLFLFHVKPELSKELSKLRKELQRKETVKVRHPKIERFEKEKMEAKKQEKDKQEEIKHDQFKVHNGKNQQEAVRKMEFDLNNIERFNNQQIETERQQEQEREKEKDWNNRLERMQKQRSVDKMHKKTPLMSHLRSLASPKGKSQINSISLSIINLMV